MSKTHKLKLSKATKDKIRLLKSLKRYFKRDSSKNDTQFKKGINFGYLMARKTLRHKILNLKLWEFEYHPKFLEIHKACHIATQSKASRILLGKFA